jgi:hypothetical protein
VQGRFTGTSASRRERTLQLVDQRAHIRHRSPDAVVDFHLQAVMREIEREGLT